MKRRLIIEGNAVYEIDEECMLKKQREQKHKLKNRGYENTEEHRNRKK